MIKFENVEIVGFEAAIRGMRNPMNSWEKSDSSKCGSYDMDCDYCKRNMYKCGIFCGKFYIGDNDLDLMKRLRNAGTDHRKFMRMITVYVDITAPLYWWKEMDTYQVGVVKNSCSTMHKIQAKEFTLEDFSYEHLFNEDNGEEDQEHYNLWLDHMRLTVIMLNRARERYLETKDKKYWWQMIQLLPASYNQKRTVMMNYEVLANIYKSRKDHKLDEWVETKLIGDHPSNMYPNKFTNGFCDWIKTLPYSELITGPSLTDIPICHEIMEEAKKRVKQRGRCSEEVLKKVEQRIRMREESKEFYTKLREEAEKEGIR